MSSGNCSNGKSRLNSIYANNGGSASFRRYRRRRREEISVENVQNAEFNWAKSDDRSRLLVPDLSNQNSIDNSDHFCYSPISSSDAEFDDGGDDGDDEFEIFCSNSDSIETTKSNQSIDPTATTSAVDERHRFDPVAENEDRQVCRHCSIEFRRKIIHCIHQYRSHRLPNCCAYCGHHTSSTEELLEHVAEEHSSARLLIVCWLCPMRFERKYEFWSHCWKAHRAFMYRCFSCGQVAFGRSSFKAHLNLCNRTSAQPLNDLAGQRRQHQKQRTRQQRRSNQLSISSSTGVPSRNRRYTSTMESPDDCPAESSLSSSPDDDCLRVPSCWLGLIRDPRVHRMAVAGDEAHLMHLLQNAYDASWRAAALLTTSKSTKSNSSAIKLNELPRNRSARSKWRTNQYKTDKCNSRGLAAGRTSKSTSCNAYRLSEATRIAATGTATTPTPVTVTCATIFEHMEEAVTEEISNDDILGKILSSWGRVPSKIGDDAETSVLAASPVSAIEECEHTQQQFTQVPKVPKHSEPPSKTQKTARSKSSMSSNAHRFARHGTSKLRPNSEQKSPSCSPEKFSVHLSSTVVPRKENGCSLSPESSSLGVKTRPFEEFTLEDIKSQADEKMEYDTDIVMTPTPVSSPLMDIVIDDGSEELALSADAEVGKDILVISDESIDDRQSCSVVAATGTYYETPKKRWLKKFLSDTESCLSVGV